MYHKSLFLPSKPGAVRPPASVLDLWLTIVLLSGRGAVKESAVTEHQVLEVSLKVDSRFLGPGEAPGQHKGMLVGQPVSPGCSWMHAVTAQMLAQ